MSWWVGLLIGFPGGIALGVVLLWLLNLGDASEW